MTLLVYNACRVEVRLYSACRASIRGLLSGSSASSKTASSTADASRRTARSWNFAATSLGLSALLSLVRLAHKLLKPAFYADTLARAAEKSARRATACVCTSAIAAVASLKL